MVTGLLDTALSKQSLEYAITKKITRPLGRAMHFFTYRFDKS